jgi:voltage-gated potassium channel
MSTAARAGAISPGTRTDGLASPAVTPTMTRMRLAAAVLISVAVVGTVGYRLFGMSWTDAAYQTVTTVTTVGFRELQPFSTGEKWFTMAIIVVGVGAALYTLTIGMQIVVEGHLREFVGRRRMDRKIADMRGHVVVCGWGRVGKAVANDLVESGKHVVVVDIDPARVAGSQHPTVVGDATLDSTLISAGIDRASALVAALQGDAENLFVTLSSRALNRELFIVARAREDASVGKLSNAGADRVVNPQELGAARMASFVARPHVAEFIDVVMHERSMEFRMQEVEVPDGSPLAGATLRDANLRQRAGVLVLALRETDGTFNTNPDPDTIIAPRHVIIAVGTDEALRQLTDVTV